MREPRTVEFNDLYPLPADYDSLTEEGQRRARLNACRLWLVPGLPLHTRADAYLAAIRFFDLWYLYPDDEADFDPLFYDEPPRTSPDGHWIILRQWATGRRNVAIAPRGFAKSKLNCKDMLLRMLARPAYSFIYATSTHDNARGIGQTLKSQFLDNQRIHDDFSPDFPDHRIVPKRGEAPFGTEYMQLHNGSWVRTISSQSRLRGGRPTRFRLDDPEYDPSASTSMSVLRGYIEQLLFRVALPMVFRSGAGIDWLATFVSRRHYAWHALEVIDTPAGPRAVDPRFDRWNRLIIPAAYEGVEGELVSCWPNMWPATKAKRLELAETDPWFKEADSLEEIRETVGPAAFNAEYLCKPGEAEDAYFLLREDKHGYRYENVDDHLATDPYRSSAQIVWERNGETVRKPLSQFLSEARLFMPADTSYSATSHSDYKATAVLAVDHNNDLFALDLWAARCQQQVLVRRIFELAEKWRVPTIHPEVAGESISLWHELEAIVRTRETTVAGDAWMPAIRPVRIPSKFSKSARIASSLFRFEHGKIKFPFWRRREHPWPLLFEQIESFNPESDGGGLQHDDCIDVVCAMPQIILKGRLSEPNVRDAPDTRTILERLRDGDLRDEAGLPYLHGVPLHTLPVPDLIEFLTERTAHDVRRPSQA